MILHLLHRNIPALHGVALLAVRAHLPAMHVGMAVCTILAHIGEHRFDVTLRALHFLVHAAQRISGFVVIEFRNRTNWTPRRCGMTVLAWSGQCCPVRTPRRLLLGLLRREGFVSRERICRAAVSTAEGG